jgi:hypothetical protein
MEVYPIIFKQLKSFINNLRKNKSINNGSPVVLLAEKEPEIGFVPCTVLATTKVNRMFNLTPPKDMNPNDEAVVIMIDKWPETVVKHIFTDQSSN